MAAGEEEGTFVEGTSDEGTFEAGTSGEEGNNAVAVKISDVAA